MNTPWVFCCCCCLLVLSSPLYRLHETHFWHYIFLYDLPFCPHMCIVMLNSLGPVHTGSATISQCFICKCGKCIYQYIISAVLVHFISPHFLCNSEVLFPSPLQFWQLPLITFSLAAILVCVHRSP